MDRTKQLLTQHKPSRGPVANYGLFTVFKNGCTRLKKICSKINHRILWISVNTKYNLKENEILCSYITIVGLTNIK